MQDQNNQMNPDQAKASLGLATFLIGHLMPQAQQQAPEAPTNQETGTDVTTQMQGLESRIMDEISTLKAEIQKAQPKDSGKEIEDLKKQIEDVLNSNE